MNAVPSGASLPTNAASSKTLVLPAALAALALVTTPDGSLRTSLKPISAAKGLCTSSLGSNVNCLSKTEGKPLSENGMSFGISKKNGLPLPRGVTNKPGSSKPLAPAFPAGDNTSTSLPMTGILVLNGLGAAVTTLPSAERKAFTASAGLASGNVASPLKTAGSKISAAAIL